MPRRTIEVRTLLWTAGGVVVASVVGLVTIALMVRPSVPGAQVSGGGNAVSGSSGVTIYSFPDFQRQAPPGSSPDEVRAAAQRFTGVPPPADGPAPFRVVDAGEKGLKVRTTGTADGAQVGSAADGATVWVDCRATTPFDPVLTDDVGAEWLLVRWPTTVRGSAFLNSEPGSPERAWVYAGYTVPAGHNGQVPTC